MDLVLFEDFAVVWESVVIAFYGLNKLRFTNHVTEAEEKGPGRGVATFDATVRNQRAEAAMMYSDRPMLNARACRWDGAASYAKLITIR